MRLDARTLRAHKQTGADEYIITIPAATMLQLVVAIGKALRDDDDMAEHLLKAAEPEPGQRQAATKALIAADALGAQLHVPGEGILDLLEDIAAAAQRSTIRENNLRISFRLCSSCGRLSEDTTPAPTTCADCRTETRA